MKIKRLEFGLARINGKIAFKDWYFNKGMASCGCYMIEIWFAYVTWLGNECYYQCGDPTCECKDDSPKNPNKE